MGETVFLNNKFLPAKQAIIPALSPGVLCGWGVFETMRSMNLRVVHLDRHLQRIRHAAKITAIEFEQPEHELKKIIRKAVIRSGFIDAHVRLTLLKSGKASDTLVTVKKYRPYSAEKYRTGFSAGVSRLRQNECSLLSRLKTTSRVLYELSLQEAKDDGFDEALILNSRGYIAEASRSNIFFAKDNCLFTPELECGCLNGITRGIILDFARGSKIKVCEGSFTVQDLLKSDEAFLTNSLIGIMPLTRVERRNIGKGRRGRITEGLIKKYNLLLQNGT